MDQATLKENWEEIKGNLQKHWSNLTDSDVDFIQGNYKMLVSKLQERYGWTKEEAHHEIDAYEE